LATKLRRFDVYSKVHDDYRIKTKSGGLISIASLTTIIFLFLSDLDTYLTVEVVDHIKVDTTLNQKLPIGVNITFPRIRCEEVSVDSVDSVGHSQIDASEGLVKLPLDANGYPIEDNIAARQGKCLPCLEAADFYPDMCCNTCSDLKEAYRKVGLPYYHLLDTAQQCSTAIGCQVHGDILVSKVSGNVHVALGRSRVRNGKHVHEFNIKEVSDGFNTSHTINRIAFGETVAGVTSPLEGATKIVRRGSYMFHYYIKLVPTSFESRQRTVYTHQYSVTDTYQNAMVRKGELLGLPGVFFVYEFTPFLVQKVERSYPFSHFVTSQLAVIGGVFTVAGMIDAVLYRSYKRIGRGKQFT